MAILFHIFPKSSIDGGKSLHRQQLVWASGWNAEGVSDPTGVRATAHSCASYALTTLGGTIQLLVEICIVITTNFQQMAVNCFKKSAPFSNSHKIAKNL